MAVGQVQFFGDLGDGKLAERVVDLVDADWGEADGCAGLVAPDLVLGVAFVSVD